MADKVIVTHAKALASKYGAAKARVDGAVDRLVAADARRGLRTRFVQLDVAADLPARAVPLYAVDDLAAAKRVIDAVYVDAQPDYLMILGGPDVVPHQRLDNPTGDPDRDVASDLPYACDADYNTNASAFRAPGRVIGRVPDLPGATDPGLLEAQLDTARDWTSLPEADYHRYFGIAARALQQSAQRNLAAIFGSHATLQLSPPEGPNWTRDLDARTHFILCHGFTLRPEFYGEPGNGPGLPVAHLATYLRGRVTTGTVVAAECCFGAELYGPGPDGHPGICVTYLASGAYGYFGSTAIAYSCANGDDYGDLLTRLFLQSLFKGASLGRAALEARQGYVELKNLQLREHDLKTIAEFVLLGDPSIHPIQQLVTAAQFATTTPGFQFTETAVTKRRQRLSDTARELKDKVSAAGGSVAERPSPTLADRMRALLPPGITEERFDSYPLLEPDQLARSSRDEQETAVAVAPLIAYHVLTALQPVEGFPNPLVFAVLATTARGGQVESLELIRSV